ncbi:DoxX family protein [Massilia sp. MB5]|uniref:DoxX family protein n=1 Tax=Massilia sp. MB5 TaxID=2919578 RepID=UPI001F109EA5|nr:DoxX family protein [Massilia sp. MB5]UMR33390.1 DoxX family protein [Massilia sp. MB5]
MHFSFSLVLLRVAVAIMFMAHAGVRVLNGTIPRFAGFLETLGFPFGLTIVWAITLFELAGGLLLIADIARKWVVSGLLFIAGMGIVLIHFQNGWFVGEHGTGGMEYSVLLMVSLLVIANMPQASRVPGLGTATLPAAPKTDDSPVA